MAAKVSTKFLENRSMFCIDGEEYKLKDHFKVGDFKQGKDDSNLYVLRSSLTRVVRKLFRVLEINSQVIQPPEKINEWCATVRVKYKIKFKKDDKFHTTEIVSVGDCRAGNIKGQNKYARYTTAMAETRADSRALRLILGLDIATDEEVLDVTQMLEDYNTEDSSPEQLMLIENKFLGQQKRTIKDIVEIIGREITELQEMNAGEALRVIKVSTKNKQD